MSDSKKLRIAPSKDQKLEMTFRDNLASPNAIDTMPKQDRLGNAIDIHGQLILFEHYTDHSDDYKSPEAIRAISHDVNAMVEGGLLDAYNRDLSEARVFLIVCLESGSLSKEIILKTASVLHCQFG